MLKFKCLGTGSSGNCYFLTDESGQILILDLGLPVMDIKKALNFDLSNVAGVVVTHAHIDHAKSVKDFEKMGIDVYKPYLDEVRKGQRTFGNYFISTFQVPHNGETCYGFLIVNGKDRVLYATDFEYISFTFKACKVNHYIVECNYQEKYIDLDSANKEHKIMGHCSLKTLKEFLKVNATWHMQNVIIVHMGKSTCDPIESIQEIKEILDSGVVVDYARPYEDYELSNQRLPFTEGD